MVNVVIRTAINSTETVMSNKTFDKITKQFELYKINDIILLKTKYFLRSRGQCVKLYSIEVIG